jgi:glycosidase
MTPGWVRDAVFYQIFPDRLARGKRETEVNNFQAWDATPNYCAFKGGTLWGVADELDRIRDLGFNSLYFTPIFSSPANHRYHTHDYLQIDPILGGDAAFEHLLNEAHARDMRIVLDGVFNHTGRSFFAFGHILENGLESPYLDWYEINKDLLRNRGTLNAYPGPVNERSMSGFDTFGYNAWWDLPALPKLNVHNPEVREYLLKVAEHWVRRGIDGWRLDVPTEINAPGFWEDFRTRVKAINSECYIVGEIWYEAPDFLRGDRFDGLMNYPLGTAIMAFFLRKLDRQLASRSAFKNLPEFHDATSFFNRIRHILDYAGEDARLSQLNLFTSHDTPRLQDLGSFEIQDCLQALTFLLLMPGAPCIYYGEEYALHGGHDPLCRGTIPEETKTDPPPFYHAIKELIAIRNSCSTVRYGSVEFGRDEAWPERAFCLTRTHAGKCARMIVNASASTIAMGDESEAWRLSNSITSLILVNGIKVQRLDCARDLPNGSLKNFVVPSHSTVILFEPTPG